MISLIAETEESGGSIAQKFEQELQNRKGSRDPSPLLRFPVHTQEA